MHLGGLCMLLAPLVTENIGSYYLLDYATGSGAPPGSPASKLVKLYKCCHVQYWYWYWYTGTNIKRDYTI